MERIREWGSVRWREDMGGLVQIRREREGDHSRAAVFQFLLGRVRLSPASENEHPFSEAGDGLTGP